MGIKEKFGCKPESERAFMQLSIDLHCPFTCEVPACAGHSNEKTEKMSRKLPKPRKRKKGGGGGGHTCKGGKKKCVKRCKRGCKTTCKKDKQGKKWKGKKGKKKKKACKK